MFRFSLKERQRIKVKFSDNLRAQIEFSAIKEHTKLLYSVLKHYSTTKINATGTAGEVSYSRDFALL
jgi:hypothetical protein